MRPLQAPSPLPEVPMDYTKAEWDCIHTETTTNLRQADTPQIVGPYRPTGRLYFRTRSTDIPVEVSWSSWCYLSVAREIAEQSQDDAVRRIILPCH